jgi:hypothetical protein
MMSHWTAASHSTRARSSAIKLQILMRKNALFAGSDGGADYWVGDIAELLPWAWKARKRAA